jgi:hypothetical protein
MAAFQFYLHLRKQKKSRVGGDDSHVVLGKKILRLKRKYEMVLSRGVTASSFVNSGEVFAHLRAVAIKRQSSMRN